MKSSNTLNSAFVSGVAIVDAPSSVASYPASSPCKAFFKKLRLSQTKGCLYPTGKYGLQTAHAKEWGVLSVSARKHWRSAHVGQSLLARHHLWFWAPGPSSHLISRFRAWSLTARSQGVFHATPGATVRHPSHRSQSSLSVWIEEESFWEEVISKT